MSMGGGKGGGGSAEIPGWQKRQSQAGWNMTKERYDLQDQILQRFMDPWGGEGPPQDTKYSNPFWWDQ